MQGEGERAINTELNDEKILKDTNRMRHDFSPAPAADALDLVSKSGSAQSRLVTSREQILESLRWWQFFLSLAHTRAQFLSHC